MLDVAHQRTKKCKSHIASQLCPVRHMMHLDAWTEPHRLRQAMREATPPPVIPS